MAFGILIAMIVCGFAGRFLAPFAGIGGGIGFIIGAVFNVIGIAFLLIVGFLRK